MTSENISVGSWVGLKLGCGGQAFQRGTEHCFVGLVVGIDRASRDAPHSPLVKFFSAQGMRTICTLRVDAGSLHAAERPSEFPEWAVSRATAET